MRTIVPFLLLCVGLAVMVGWRLYSVADSPRAPSPRLASQAAQETAKPANDEAEAPTAAASGVDAEANADEAAGAETSAGSADAARDGAAPEAASAEALEPDADPAAADAADVGTTANPTDPASDSDVGTAPSEEAPDDADVKWAGQAPRQSAEDRLAFAQQTLADDPMHPTALRDAAAALMELDRHVDALPLLKRLVEAEPNDVAARTQYATILSGRQLWGLAHAQWLQVVEATDDDTRAWHNLAVAAKALGRVSEARDAWSRVLAAQPDDLDALAGRAEASIDLRDWSAAEDDLARLVEIDPDATDGWLNLSLVRAKQGETRLAYESLGPLLERKPNHVPTMNRLAALSYALSKLEPEFAAEWLKRGEGWCVQSLAAAPGQPDTQSLLRVIRQDQADAP